MGSENESGFCIVSSGLEEGLKIWGGSNVVGKICPHPLLVELGLIDLPKLWRSPPPLCPLGSYGPVHA